MLVDTDDFDIPREPGVAETPLAQAVSPPTMAADDSVEYEPVSVKALLTEMKDLAELLIDLAYSGVLLDDAQIAAEVIELEDEMDVLQLRARMSLLMAARNPEDAEALAPVLGIVGAAEKISDAAGDIAKIVSHGVGLPGAMRGALPEAVETLVRAELAPNSPFAGRTLGDINLETTSGVRVIAIRRTGDWLLNPDATTELVAGDVLLCRGPEDALEVTYPEITGEEYEPPPEEAHSIDDLERAVDSIVLMKNMSELAVDLAYSALLLEDEELAEEVFELEAEVDALQSRFEIWVLRSVAKGGDPESLRGLIHLAQSTEVISDAALEISEGVLRGIGTHPVVSEAVMESDEVIVRVEVAEGALAGQTIGDAAVKTRTGTTVIAVRRGTGETREWIVSPGPSTDLRAGDVLIAKGTRAGAETLAELAGDRDIDVDT